jgi:hypothetical protein
MVGTTLSTNNTTINREENKNNGGHYIEYQCRPLFLFSSRFIVVLLVLNVVSTIVFIFFTIYSGVVGIEYQQHHYKS